MISKGWVPRMALSFVRIIIPPSVVPAFASLQRFLTSDLLAPICNRHSFLITMAAITSSQIVTARPSVALKTTASSRATPVKAC